MGNQYIVPSRVVIQEVLSETVLLDMDNGEYFELNETGSRMFALLQESGDAQKALEALSEEYDVSDDILTRDFGNLLRELRVKGLIEENHEAPPTLASRGASMD
jgi:hypothetical protein